MKKSCRRVFLGLALFSGLNMGAHGLDRLISQVYKENGPDQLSIAEYALIAQAIEKRAPGNVLIFGMGNDSKLWIRANSGGRTVFLEDDIQWLQKARVENGLIEAYLVHYNTFRKDYISLLTDRNRLEDFDFPLCLLGVKWDVIFVDAPPDGYVDLNPGRMKSIYWAAKLAFSSRDTHVFVHDCDRPVEQLYCDTFLQQKKLVQFVGRLRHYYID